MWCEHCRQNVAGMLSETQDSVCCSRCGQALAGAIPNKNVKISETTPVADAPGSPSSNLHPSSFILHPSSSPPCPPLPHSALESWDLDEDLRHIERLLRRDAPRFDAPAWHAAPLRVHTQTASTSPAFNHAMPWWAIVVGAFSWLLICAGLAATVCGVILLAWTWLGGRADLLIPGLACAAAGQFGLLGGFLIQPAPRQSASAAPSAESEHPGAQWLDFHRHIEDILRADVPPGRGPEGAS